MTARTLGYAVGNENNPADPPGPQLDGVIRQLSGAAVGYPTRQQPIVRDITAVPGPA